MHLRIAQVCVYVEAVFVHVSAYCISVCLCLSCLRACICALHKCVYVEAVSVHVSAYCINLCMQEEQAHIQWLVGQTP